MNKWKPLVRVHPIPLAGDKFHEALLGLLCALSSQSRLAHIKLFDNSWL